MKLGDSRAPEFDGWEVLALSLEIQERGRVQMSRTCHSSPLIHVSLGSKGDLSQARVMEPAELGEEICNGAGRSEWNPHMSMSSDLTPSKTASTLQPLRRGRIRKVLVCCDVRHGVKLSAESELLNQTAWSRRQLQLLVRRHAGCRGASFFAATPCMPRTLALKTEPYGSVYGPT